jgi:hypothetical protein
VSDRSPNKRASCVSTSLISWKGAEMGVAADEVSARFVDVRMYGLLPTLRPATHANTL